MYENELNPNNYKIHLILDPKEEFNFQGITEIKITPNTPVDSLTLNSDNLAIWNCMIKAEKDEWNCTFKSNPKEDQLIIYFPKKVAVPFTVIVNYMGKFSKDLLGLYRCKYVYKGKEGFVLSTQFEEHYARRAFPCFDHPSKKSVFDIEFVIDKDLIGVSNTEIKEEKELENGKKLVIFKQTPKMCTYLLYFGVSEFESIEDTSGDYLIRVLTTPGKAQYGKFALETARNSLDFCEKYTGIKYPLTKCDLLGIPDFPFGAMENYGAITFRESMFLLYPKISSSMVKLTIAGVTAHEVSHFWFGDLVSPTDWQYIWLNESFASYFPFAFAEKYFPEWHLWENFIIRYYSIALERDGLNDTFAVELPDGVTEFASPAKTEIVYDKGASVLRMLQGYLGDAAFKKAINYFLKKYQFSCANTSQYWDAFEEATGQPIRKFAENWINQPGHPIINVSMKKGELILRQERFSYSPNTFEESWLIPIDLLIFLENGESKTMRMVLSHSSENLKVPSEMVAFKLNHQQKGFYRVKYEKENLMKLGELMKQGKLTSTDRFGIENDYFAMLKRGDYSLEEYLNLISSCYPQEEDYLLLISVGSHLMELNTILTSKREKISEIANLFFETWFEKHGINPIEGEEFLIAISREPVLLCAYTLNCKQAKDAGEKIFNDLLEGNEVHQDILASVYKIGAASNEKANDFLLKKVLAPETPEIEKMYILQALGCFKDEKKIKDTLNLALKQIPQSSRHIVFGVMGRNPHALEHIWPWFLKNHETLEKEGPISYARAIASLLPRGGLPHLEEVKKFLHDHLKEKKIAEDTIRMVLEELEINSRLRNL